MHDEHNIQAISYESIELVCSRGVSFVARCEAAQQKHTETWASTPMSGLWFWVLFFDKSFEAHPKETLKVPVFVFCLKSKLVFLYRGGGGGRG